MKTVTVVRHVLFEDLGAFENVLVQLGYAVRYHDAPTMSLDPERLLASDLLVILGGPIGAYDGATYPFLEQEIALARARMASDLPLLGICLGSQIMAAALDASVYPGTAGKEIGWSPLQLTAAGQASALAEIGPRHTNVLHWHGDTFDLPKGATLLASTDKYAHQAFSYGRSALALQFHPEVDALSLERWYVGHAGELGAVGIDVNVLRAAGQREAPRLVSAGATFFARWLAAVMQR